MVIPLLANHDMKCLLPSLQNGIEEAGYRSYVEFAKAFNDHVSCAINQCLNSSWLGNLRIVNLRIVPPSKPHPSRDVATEKM